ncbi:MAG: CotH kinase family protein [Paludibacteraceae bacterium]|nr:CotH kinase family protein [Paludibacteraceae bacterium]
MKKIASLFAILIVSLCSFAATGYCIAGDGDAHENWCCGLYWDASSCKLSDEGIYETTLSAGTYSFKITNGSWSTNWGYKAFNSSQSTVNCYPEKKDGNVMFTLDKTSKILISFSENNGIIVTEGTAPAPVTCNPSSGTLPIMYLNTDSGLEITDDENYVPATVYIDAMGIPGYESLGTKEEPLVAETKGRGNYTWTGFDKKPYALKFAKKQTPLGLTKDKSFTLLAHADDSDAFLRNTLGFKLSRLFGLVYTPGQEPFELYINGIYRGIYFLTDKLKISSNRVQVTEQEEGETDPALVTGGWLLEIDNYDEDESVQFRMEEKDGDILRVTSKSPEVMSKVQYDYMWNYLYNTNEAIHKGGWENYIDLDTLVNFYLVQEVMGNNESFHGSCYMHKERGDNTKLEFGPVWDFGSSLHHYNGLHIYEFPTWGDTWIDDLAAYPSFQNQCAIRWREVRGSLYPELKKEADAFIDKISAAAACDLKKWPEYGNDKIQTKKSQVLAYLKERMEWLDEEWGVYTLDQYGVDSDNTVLSVYPNPTDGELNITGIDNVEEVYVTTMSGGRICTLDASSVKWQTNLDKGLYIINVMTKSGEYYNGKFEVR